MVKCTGLMEACIGVNGQQVYKTGLAVCVLQMAQKKKGFSKITYLNQRSKRINIKIIVPY